MMHDLVDLANELKQRGASLASQAQDREIPGWSDCAFRAIESIAHSQATVHVDDVLVRFPARPRHANAWGAVWMRAIKAGIITRTGTVKPCTVDPKKHGHQYPVYASNVWGGR